MCEYHRQLTAKLVEKRGLSEADAMRRAREMMAEVFPVDWINLLNEER